MSRAANPDYPIHELFIKRHSPYAFDPARERKPRERLAQSKFLL